MRRHALPLGAEVMRFVCLIQQHFLNVELLRKKRKLSGFSLTLRFYAVWTGSIKSWMTPHPNGKAILFNSSWSDIETLLPVSDSDIEKKQTNTTPRETVLPGQCIGTKSICCGLLLQAGIYCTSIYCMVYKHSYPYTIWDCASGFLWARCGACALWIIVSI